jgi:hypothetical protein
VGLRRANTFGIIAPAREQAMFNKAAYQRRIRLLRAVYGDNQTKFAKRVGIPYKRWHHYERGYPIPREIAFTLHDKIPGFCPCWLWFGDEQHLSPKLRRQLRHVERIWSMRL